MKPKYTHSRHLIITLVLAVIFIVFGALYATSVIRTQKTIEIGDDGWYTVVNDDTRVVSFVVDIDFILPVDVLGARYPVDVIVRIKDIEFTQSFDWDRTFFIWYEHLEIDGVGAYNPETNQWLQIEYKEGSDRVESHQRIVFPYEGPYGLRLVEEGNWSFSIRKADYDDQGRVITVASPDAVAAQYFNNLIFGIGLASAGFAGVPLVSDMTWKLIEARREEKEVDRPTDEGNGD